jgi:hypothetical protein
MQDLALVGSLLLIVGVVIWALAERVRMNRLRTKKPRSPTEVSFVIRNDFKRSILPPPPKPPADHDTLRDDRVNWDSKLDLAREIVALAHQVDPVEVRAHVDDDILGQVLSLTCLLPERALHFDMQRTQRVCEMACGCPVHVCAPTHDTDADDLDLLELEPEPTDGSEWS